MRASMVRSGGDGGQCNNRQPRQVLAAPVDSSAEHIAGDVERCGHGGNGDDDALDLETEGLVGGNGDGHGVSVGRFAKQQLGQAGCC